MDISIKDTATALTALSGVIAGIIGVFKYFQYKTRRDKIAAVGEAFNSVVHALASDIEVERLAGGIRLRRFFDPESEVGIVSAPYASEAINVIAAVLRTQKSGTFQKLLADGLAYAPSLSRADLQRTNLQNAYLGFRKTGGEGEGLEIDLSYADFYRADLSGASLKRATAKGAVFYQARLHNTILSGADLRDANFFEADLTGARFDGAMLACANFKEARNVPPDLARKLDTNGVYPNETKPFEPALGRREVSLLRVFLSKPGFLVNQQRQFVVSVRGFLQEQGMVCEELERIEYPKFGAIAEVRRRMSGCAGVVILGLRQLKVLDGVWRSDTAEETKVRDMELSTPWSQIEAGMAIMRGLPLLLLHQPGVVGGIFDSDANERLVYQLEVGEDWSSFSLRDSFATWCAAVREQAQAVGGGDTVPKPLPGRA
jgi:hypothetical protein